MSYKELWLKYSKLEEKYAENLERLSNEIENLVVKAILNAVAKDSYKHSLIFKSLSVMEEGYKKLIEESEFGKIGGEIDDHIKTEEDMIKRVESLIPEIKDRAMKFLLEAILKDEVLHHSLLIRVKEMIIKREVFSESTLWDMVWKDAVFRGTPGG